MVRRHTYEPGAKLTDTQRSHVPPDRSLHRPRWVMLSVLHPDPICRIQSPLGECGAMLAAASAASRTRLGHFLLAGSVSASGQVRRNDEAAATFEVAAASLIARDQALALTPGLGSTGVSGLISGLSTS